MHGAGPFTPGLTHDRSMARLNDFRNEFIHFTPKGWALQLAGLPTSCLDGLCIIGYFGWETTSITWYKSPHALRRSVRMTSWDASSKRCMCNMQASRSFETDTQRHCAARRAGEHTPATQCRCAPVNSDVILTDAHDLDCFGRNCYVLALRCGAGALCHWLAGLARAPAQPAERTPPLGVAHCAKEPPRCIGDSVFDKKPRLRPCNRARALFHQRRTEICAV